MPSTTTVQNAADENTVQPSNSSSVRAAGTKLRRRLSNSFQRDRADIRFLRYLPSTPGAQGSNQTASCQSPRIQRWRRLTSAP